MNASPRVQKLLPDDSGVSLQGGVNISIPVSPGVQIYPLVTLNTHTHTHLHAALLEQYFVSRPRRTHRGSEQVGLCPVPVPLDRPHVPLTLTANLPLRFGRSLQVDQVEEAPPETRRDGTAVVVSTRSVKLCFWLSVRELTPTTQRGSPGSPRTWRWPENGTINLFTRRDHNTAEILVGIV